MNLQEFKNSNFDSDWKPLLQSLWYDAQGDWDKAHHIADSLHDPEGSWVHAYLHRKEGDQWNANYWYRRAGKNTPNYSLEEEWEELAQYFLTEV
jgi:hypothetical protein